jgi:hypothetical protein
MSIISKVFAPTDTPMALFHIIKGRLMKGRSPADDGQPWLVHTDWKSGRRDYLGNKWAGWAVDPVTKVRYRIEVTVETEHRCTRCNNHYDMAEIHAPQVCVHCHADDVESLEREANA